MDWLEMLDSLQSTTRILQKLGLYFKAFDNEEIDTVELSKGIWEEIRQQKSKYPSFKDAICEVLRSDSNSINKAAHDEIVFIHDKVLSLIKGLPKHIMKNANRMEEDSSGESQSGLRPEGLIQLYLFSIANNCRYYKSRLAVKQSPASAALPDKRRQFEIPDNEAGRYAVRQVLEAFQGRRKASHMTRGELSALIERADFSSIYIDGRTGSVGKVNVKYAIYYLSCLMGKDWYDKAAQSIGESKSACAGAVVSQSVKDLLDKDRLLNKITMRPN